MKKNKIFSHQGGEQNKNTEQSFSVCPGVNLKRFCFQSDGMTEQRAASNILEINFCVCGRFETSFAPLEQVTLNPGDMAVSMYCEANPTETWSSFPLGYYEGLCLLVKLAEANEWENKNAGIFAVNLFEMKENLIRDKWYWVNDAGPRCEHVFRELHECMSYSDVIYIQLKVMELFMLLTKINYSKSETDYYPKSQIDIVRHIRDHLVSQPSANSQIDELVAEHHISVSQFRKIFRSVYGKPVYQYLMEYRLEQGAVELSGTDKPITEIACELGFSSPSKFAENFKKLYEVTPRQYRQFGK